MTADTLARVLVRALRMAAGIIEDALREAEVGEAVAEVREGLHETSAPGFEGPPSPVGRPLSARQAQVLAIIHRSIKERGYPPTLREIGEEMGIHSTNGVNDHLRALERKGWISRDAVTARGIVVHDERAAS